MPLLLIAAVVVSLLRPDVANLNSIASKIQDDLQQNETLFRKESANAALTKALVTGDFKAAPLLQFTNRHVYLYLYRNDSLVSWTGNAILPPATISSFEDGALFMKLKSGWYQVIKSSKPAKHEMLVGLRPVKLEYPFENRFLQSSFVEEFHIPANVQLSDQKIEGSVPVFDSEGTALFSLYISGEAKGTDVNWLILIAQLLLVSLAFYYINQLALRFKTTAGFPLAFAVLIVSVVIARGLMLYFRFPFECQKLELFNSMLYGSSIITPSLGDLIIDSVIMVWWVAFWQIHRPGIQNKTRHSVAALLLLFFVFAFTGLITWIFKTLVIDSIISFEIYNVLSLGFYSFLGLACISMLIISHFLVSATIISLLRNSGVSFIRLLIAAFVFAVVFSLAALNSEFYESILFAAVWTLLFIAIVYLVFNGEEKMSVRRLILYIATYSLFTTYLIENLYERKERNQRVFFAGKLVTERDFVAEYMFGDIAGRISGDAFIRNFFKNPVVSPREITDRINSLYLGGYFNKYDLKLRAFDAKGMPVKNEDSVVLADYLAIRHGKKTASVDTLSANHIEKAFSAPELAYISDTAQNYSYISVIEIKGDSLATGYLTIELTPKVYYSQNVYPELLVGSSVTLFNNVYNYNYAIYQNDKLIGQYGDYPYTYYWNKEYVFNDGDGTFIEEDEWEHNIQRFANGKKVVVSIPREPLFEPVATFSYLFSFLFVIVVVVLIGLRINRMGADEKLSAGMQLSFRTRINYSMLLMIVISFIIIGFITIGFFRRQYDNFYSDKLFRKEKAIHASLEYFIQRNTLNTAGLSQEMANELNFEVARLANINLIDINVFDKNGDLSVSSQPGIYDKALVSKKMNPQAYFRLENTRASQITQQENIGKLSYLATYSPILNKQGDAIAYLGIPYFERAKDINNEVSTFLVALMNVYVFLLIVAAILAYFISNSVTRPLTIISEKLRVLNLNKKNEPIEWDSNDEIGVLIGEYNKMISELEQSAQKLAKGERESAWREMAKQIAHEIKNPLTPMKLSIQYLQKAIDDGNPNIEQLARRVAKTLEEQIENLSSIATAFSTFAKMPKPENEIINLNELLKSISELFNREGNAHVEFETKVEGPLVFADKNQLISVFNNLVKNAIQSIPENREGFVDVKVDEEDGWLIVSVKDNGIGITRENHDKVFVPNFTTKSSGTGLGLAICKQIIDGNGGSIWFESKANEGTTFFVRLKKMKE